MKRKIIGKLIKWKENPKDSNPILLYGAKQVGKTYAVKEFAALCYENLVYVNFEEQEGVQRCFKENSTIEKLIRSLESYYKTIIIPNKTLLFFDEIHLCSEGMQSLKLFGNLKENYPVVAVCNALPYNLEWVQRLQVFPLDFEEFLWARGKKCLSDQIREQSKKMEKMPEEMHQEATTEYRHYLLCGGMPTVVCAHLYHKNPMKEQEYKELIVDSYVSDMMDLLSSSSGIKAKEAYYSIGSQLLKENKKFQYKHIKQGGRASFYAEIIHFLTTMGVAYRCEKNMDSASFKLYMSDTGLLASKLRLDADKLILPEGKEAMDAVTENYVACQLYFQGHALKYWVSSGIAEVDFLIQKREGLIPIALNLEENTKAKSLAVYCEKFHPPYSIRISTANFSFENNVKNIPVYGVFTL